MNSDTDKSKQSNIHDVMPSPFLSANENAIIQDEFKAYSVSWRCNKGHINFQTIIVSVALLVTPVYTHKKRKHN